MTQVSFFASVQSFARPFVKAAVAVDPLVAARSKFATVADEQVTLIKSGASKGFWFKKHGTGYVLTLKNGATAINREHPSFAVGSAADAFKFLERAKAAAEKGEFDAMFKATARAPRSLKSADPKLNPPVVAPAPATPQIAPVAAKRTRK